MYDALFLSEFVDLFLNIANLLGGKLVIGGDLKVHFNRPADPTGAKVLDLIQLFGLSQTVEFPTHSGDHTLDLLIYRDDDRIVSIHLSASHHVLRPRASGVLPGHRQTSVLSRVSDHQKASQH